MTAASVPNGVTTISNADYHADHGALSASGAKKLLPPSCPALYKWELDHPVYKDEFDLGNAAHAMVLHDGSVKLAIYQAENWRTKASQEFKKAAREAGQVPMLPKDVDTVKAMAEQILAHSLASKLFTPGSGKCEQSLKWLDERTGIQRRGRLDWLPNPGDGRMIIPDYKTAISAAPSKFQKTAADLAYHMQAAWYIDSVRACGLDDDPAFVFVVQEKTPPYLVTPIELDDTAINIGRHLNDQALDVYAECCKSGVWPGYSDGVELIELPGWYTRKFEDIP